MANYLSDSGIVCCPVSGSVIVYCNVYSDPAFSFSIQHACFHLHTDLGAEEAIPVATIAPHLLATIVSYSYVEKNSDVILIFLV